MTLSRVRSIVRHVFVMAAVTNGVRARSLSAQRATGRIEGHVRDTATHAIANVTVVLVGHARSVRTNVRGEYALDSIPPGTYQIRYTMMGYRPMEISGLRVLAGSMLNGLDVPLQAAPVPVQPVAITPRRGRFGDQVDGGWPIAQPVTKLPLDQIAQILALQPGVVVVGGPPMLIRAGQSEQILTYINGIFIGGSRGPIRRL
jgi:hypothetical protein